MSGCGWRVLWACAVLVWLLLVVDWLPARTLVHLPNTATTPQPCAQHPLGRWSIGMAHGSSPLTLHPVYTHDDQSIGALRKGCMHVPGTMKPGSLKDFTTAHLGVHRPQFPFAETWADAQPNLWPAPPLPQNTTGSSTVEGGAAYSCDHIKPLAGPVSSVSEPTLVIDRQDPSHLHMFSQGRNLVTGLGEILVAESFDFGASWVHLGHALSLSQSIGYPSVFYEAEHSRYLMVIDAEETPTIQIFVTTPAEFPFGWKFAYAPLPDASHHQPSPVLYQPSCCDVFCKNIARCTSSMLPLIHQVRRKLVHLHATQERHSPLRHIKSHQQSLART
eukprot:m.530098 g.530098  ORF g.530098 m.530098 type:complete len:332 (-) comp57567_c1_seq8:1520-2515(-)